MERVFLESLKVRLAIRLHELFKGRLMKFCLAFPKFQANRDAGIREAECEKAAMDVKYNTDTKIEDNSRAFKLQKANFDKEVNTAVSTCLLPQT